MAFTYETSPECHFKVKRIHFHACRFETSEVRTGGILSHAQPIHVCSAITVKGLTQQNVNVNANANKHHHTAQNCPKLPAWLANSTSHPYNNLKPHYKAQAQPSHSCGPAHPKTLLNLPNVRKIMPKSNKYRKDQQAANVGTRMPI
jgi:hypothetical protein